MQVPRGVGVGPYLLWVIFEGAGQAASAVWEAPYECSQTRAEGAIIIYIAWWQQAVHRAGFQLAKCGEEESWFYPACVQPSTLFMLFFLSTSGYSGFQTHSLSGIS